MLHRGVAQPGLAHLNGVQGVGGSNPLAPIKIKKMLTKAIKKIYLLSKKN